MIAVGQTSGSACLIVVPFLHTWSWLVKIMMRTGTLGLARTSVLANTRSVSGTLLARFDENVGRPPDVPLTLPSPPSHIEPESLRRRPIKSGKICLGASSP